MSRDKFKHKKKKDKKPNLIIVEGETEEKFLNSFYSNLKYPSRCKIHNIFLSSLPISITSKFNSKNEFENLFYIIDADMLLDPTQLNDRINNFINNNSKIIANKKYLLVQYKDFEDELVFCFEYSNNKKLFELFNSEGIHEFKSNFIRQNNIANKFKNFSFYKMYTRYKSIEEILSKITPYINSIMTGKDFYINDIIK